MKESVLYKIVRPIVSFLFKLIFRPKVIGKEKVPKSGKIILAGNHTSIFDCIFLMSITKRPIHFLAKKELWIGPKKLIFKHMGLIPVDRKTHDSTPIKIAEDYLLDDKVIGIFPEGTTEKGRGLLKFKIGAVKIAYDTKSPIIPFVIKGKYKMFSKDLKMIIGDEIKVSNDDLDIENDKFRSIIKDLMEDK